MDPEAPAQAAKAAAAEAVSAATHAATSATSAAAAAGAAGGTRAAVDAVAAATAQAPPQGLAIVLDRLMYVVMVPMVYAAILALIAGVAYRVVAILRAPPQPWVLRTHPVSRRPVLAALGDAFGMPQIRKRRPLFWAFLMVYHVAFLLLFLGHLDILPRLNLVSPESRHMIGRGGVGVAVTIPMVYFLVRRLRSPVREISVPADFLLLLFLLCLFLLGDMMSWSNSWNPAGFVMTKQSFSEYFHILASFSFADPRTVLHGSHYHFAVLHVLFANLLFIILPFTKIVHAFFALPINLIRRR
jgi:nitrate reductase gamma subunit